MPFAAVGSFVCVVASTGLGHGADQISELIRRSEDQPEQLIEWAKTELGEPLAGTTFIVTHRCDD